MIPIFEIIKNEDNPDDLRAKELFTNSFWYIQKTDTEEYDIVPVEYDIFYRWQQYNMELEQRLNENEAFDEGMKFDTEVTPRQMQHEEEMTYLRANELYHLIINEWDTIVLSRPTGNFKKDMNNEIEKEEYLDSTVFERAWEVKDIIETFIQGHYQPKSLFGNYDEIYDGLSQKTGIERSRDLVKLSRLMGKCVTPEVIQRKQELVESIIPAGGSIKDA